MTVYPKKSLMFGFITKTWNPIVVYCRHECEYCYARPIIDDLRLRTGKYAALTEDPDALKLHEAEFDTFFNEGDFVFVCSMCDLFAENIPEEWIERILFFIAPFKAKFLLLTKNPARMAKFSGKIPANCTVGITLETNRVVTLKYSKAPTPVMRVDAFKHFLHEPFERFVCIEPIMDFDTYPFAKMIHELKPHLVSIGYDNHDNKLPEPTLSLTYELIYLLENEGVWVNYKTLREKWDAPKC